MTITMNAIEQVGPRTWRQTFSSDAVSPTLRVYANGLLIRETTQSITSIDINATTEPLVEVTDDGSEPQQLTYPGRLLLQWYAVDGARLYRVERYVDAAWSEIGAIPDTGAGYYDYLTALLPDETEAVYRVTPMDSLRNAGTPVSFTALIVRNPDPPAVVIAYDSGDITVEAA